MAKYPSIISLLKRRIARGDYILSGFPSERRLAEGLNVCRVTVRKAVQELLDSGHLLRVGNGRLVVSPRRADGGRRVRVAFLAPAFASPFIQRLRLATERIGSEMGATVRAVEFVHWDDPVIGETFESFDGVFIGSIAPDEADRLPERIRKAGCPVVSLEVDLSALGIPSLVLYPPQCVHRLLDHLASLGHRHIDCLNVLPDSVNVARRIKQWEVWRHAHAVEGTLFSEPEAPYSFTGEVGYRVMKELCSRRVVKGTAIFSTSEIAAMGAMHALREAGVVVGRDLSVCTLGGDGYYRYLSPTLTALEMPSYEPYLRSCFDWILRGGEAWRGPLCMEPTTFHLFEGESTGPCPAGAILKQAAGCIRASGHC